jgi:phosphoribosyl 1,2-cyclic phosphodiesterase
LPVYITPNTYRGTGFSIDEKQVQSFKAFEAVQVGALSITAFPKWHDAADPHSFIVSSMGVTAGVFTDIGEPCKNVISYFRQCHAIFLESNYDETMLANSRYPVYLRNRISGKHGHLSNDQALQLFIKHRPPFMTHIFLSHLSKENNEPAIATALFSQHANGAAIIHAPRHGATAVYEIVAKGQPIAVPIAPPVRKKMVKAKTQLSLF